MIEHSRDDRKVTTISRFYHGHFYTAFVLSSKLVLIGSSAGSEYCGFLSFDTRMLNFICD